MSTLQGLKLIHEDKRLQFLNEINVSYLCYDLTLDFNDLKVIDNILFELNSLDDSITGIIEHNKSSGLESTLNYEGAQIIIAFDKYSVKGSLLATATLLKNENGVGLPPMLHINLHSPTLDVPQRIEIPLRYVLKGAAPLTGTYMVYLHALQINTNETFIYYGITKRGWMKRFIEHTRLAIKGKSQRRFPKLLREGIQARIYELLHGTVNSTDTKLTGTYHVVCAAGRTKKNAFEIEKYLIEKHSLFVNVGLNMISGNKIGKL